MTKLQNPGVPKAFKDHLDTAPPAVLYHYTSQEGLLGIIENHELWATKVQFMNDATEFGLALSVAEDILNEKIEKSSDEAFRKRLSALLGMRTTIRH